MEILRNIYYWFHRNISMPEERGEYSAGYWQDRVRTGSLRLCQGIKGKLLEVGCGEGFFLARLGLSNAGVESWGLDNNVEILEKAKKRFTQKNLHSIKLFEGDATDLPFPDSFFDTVVCVNVLLNMPSKDAAKKALKEMFRVCKSGGKIIFDFRNALNPLLNLKYKLAPYYDATIGKFFLKTFRKDEIETVLKQINCEIVRQPYVSFPKGKFTPIILLEVRKL